MSQAGMLECSPSEPGQPCAPQASGSPAYVVWRGFLEREQVGASIVK